MRHGSRGAVSQSLGISSDWATVRQIHGDQVWLVTGPGQAGDGDGLVTSTPQVPLAVFTADCLGVIIVGRGGVGVAHAGWRGLVDGVVAATLDRMRLESLEPIEAAIGPAIGPCCFEVGGEVLDRFSDDHRAVTTWGTPAVDLASAAADQLADLAVWNAGLCTKCGDGFYSHRRDRTMARMAALTWLT